MDQDTSRAGQAVDEQAEPEEIRREIDQTREELGDTVASLAAKSDVKSQAKAKVDQAKGRVSERKDEVLGKARQATPDSASSAATQVKGAARENPMPVAIGAGFVAGFLLGRLTGRS
jgi:ElaB/YqjD/DUF883 family membrane-anchored ribosome-binding protein